MRCPVPMTWMDYKRQGALKKADFDCLIAVLEFANSTWKRRMQFDSRYAWDS